MFINSLTNFFLLILAMKVEPLASEVTSEMSSGEKFKNQTFFNSPYGDCSVKSSDTSCAITCNSVSTYQSQKGRIKIILSEIKCELPEIDEFLKHNMSIVIRKEKAKDKEGELEKEMKQEGEKSTKKPKNTKNPKKTTSTSSEMPTSSEISTYSDPTSTETSSLPPPSNQNEPVTTTTDPGEVETTTSEPPPAAPPTTITTPGDDLNSTTAPPTTSTTTRDPNAMDMTCHEKLARGISNRFDTPHMRTENDQVSCDLFKAPISFNISAGRTRTEIRISFTSIDREMLLIYYPSTYDPFLTEFNDDVIHCIDLKHDQMPIFIDDMRPSVPYLICAMYSSVQFFHCKSYMVERGSTWIAESQAFFTLILTCAAFIFAFLVGVTLSYLMLYLYPSLLRGSPRVIIVKDLEMENAYKKELPEVPAAPIYLTPLPRPPREQMAVVRSASDNTWQNYMSLQPPDATRHSFDNSYVGVYARGYVKPYIYLNADYVKEMKENNSNDGYSKVGKRQKRVSSTKENFYNVVL